MLPALARRPDNQIDRIQDKLDFAARDIEEERRERVRMKEQLSIQNQIINKLYTRLNQFEEENAATKETINSILQSSLMHHQMEHRKLLKIDRNTEVEETRERLQILTCTIQREADTIRTVTDETRKSLASVQDYLGALHQSDQTNCSRLDLLESNTEAAMQCIKSIQKGIQKLHNKLALLEGKGRLGENESTFTASLQDVTRCLQEAKTERECIHQKLLNSVEDTTALKEQMQVTREQMQGAVLSWSHKQLSLSQSVDELAALYRDNMGVQELYRDLSKDTTSTKQLLSFLTQSVAKEKTVRLEWEKKLRKETASVLNNLRQNLGEQLTKYVNVSEEREREVDASITQLHKSVGLIEQSSEATKHGLEHILQAEITTRASKLHEIEEHIKTVRAAIGTLDIRREEETIKILNDFKDTKGGMDKLSDQLNTTTHQLGTTLREAHDQMRVEMEERISRVEEIIEETTANIAILHEDLSTEHGDRKQDIGRLGEESLEHGLDLQALRSEIESTNNNLYEVEERMTEIEAGMEEVTMVTRLPLPPRSHGYCKGTAIVEEGSWAHEEGVNKEVQQMNVTGNEVTGDDNNGEERTGDDNNGEERTGEEKKNKNGNEVTGEEKDYKNGARKDDASRTDHLIPEQL